MKCKKRNAANLSRTYLHFGLPEEMGRQELGIRLALGAQRVDVLRLIIGQGMRLVGIGAAFGLAGVFASTRLLQSLLFGVGATDLPTLVGVTILLDLVGWPRVGGQRGAPVLSIQLSSQGRVNK